MNSPRKKLTTLLESKLPFSVVFWERKVSLETLLGYSVGSVIVLSGVERPRLEVAGAEVGEGTPVTVGDALALRLDKVRSPESYLKKITIE